MSKAVKVQGREYIRHPELSDRTGLKILFA